MAEVKQQVLDHVDALADDLVRISHEIHARPELGYEEHFAADLLASTLEAHGVEVERGAYGLATSFAGRAGSDGPHVVVCCEYDALPTVGHGCGHNVIAAAGLGAGLALAGLAERCGGRLTVLGTPAEEQSGGGKIRLLDAGAFADADVAMMVHPEPGDVERVPYLANDVIEVEYHGVSAHASSSPWQGRNALDGLVSAYTALQALRGQLAPDHKVFGIITDGGDADNTVPAFAAGRFRVRAPTAGQLELLKERVLGCFEGAAAQTGTRLEHRWIGGYADLVANRPLAAAYRRNGEALGRRFVDPRLIPAHVAGSTDMGNVSHAVPTIHPVVRACDLGTPGHSHEMREAAAAPLADAAVVDAAKALAMTAIDYWTDAALRDEVRADFERRVRGATR